MSDIECAAKRDREQTRVNILEAEVERLRAQLQQARDDLDKKGRECAKLSDHIKWIAEVPPAQHPDDERGWIVSMLEAMDEAKSLRITLASTTELLHKESAEVTRLTNELAAKVEECGRLSGFLSDVRDCPTYVLAKDADTLRGDLDVMVNHLAARDDELEEARGLIRWAVNSIEQPAWLTPERIDDGRSRLLKTVAAFLARTEKGGA